MAKPPMKPRIQKTFNVNAEQAATIKAFCKRNNLAQQELFLRGIRLANLVDLITREGGAVKAVRKDGSEEIVRLM